MILTSPDGTTWRIETQFGSVRAVRATPRPGEPHYGVPNGPRYLVVPRDNPNATEKIVQRLQVNDLGQVSVGPTSASPPINPDDIKVTDLSVTYTALPNDPATVDDDDMYRVLVTWTLPTVTAPNSITQVNLSGHGKPGTEALVGTATSFEVDLVGGTAVEAVVSITVETLGGDPRFVESTAVTAPVVTLPAPTTVYGAPRNVQVTSKPHPNNPDYFQFIATWDAPDGPAPAFYRVTRHGLDYDIAYSTTYDALYADAGQSIDGYGVKAVYGSQFTKSSAIVAWPTLVAGFPGDQGAGGTGFYDNFERADNTTTMGDPWVPHQTKGFQAGQQSVWGIKRGQAYQASGLYSAATTVAGDGATSGFVEFQPGELGNTIGGGGVIIRADSTGAGIAIHYDGYGSNGDGTGMKVVVRNWAAYNSSTGFPTLGWFPDWKPGDLVRIDWTPNDISYTLNGAAPVVLATTALAANTRRGLVSDLSTTLFRNFRTNTV